MTRSTNLDLAHWQDRLEELAEKHKVPGAQLGILAGDEIVEVAVGTLNKRTGQPATTDSVFQIGSVSKVWTATVVMQLIDEGKLALDTPVVEVIPELQLSDPDVTKQLTIWHLLTHTSGIDGDVFTDTGRGDDCLEKYTELLADVAQNHPLGATWSYCNSGWSLLGRVIEKLTDQTWDQAMKDKLFTPLGLDSTVTLAEEAILFGAAVGHVEAEGEQIVTPVWDLPRSVGPAGLIKSTVRDVLGFARLHLSGGLAPDGTRVLSAESAEAMTQHHADLPDKFILGDSWGLGWIRFDWNGTRLIGHDGNTLGQAGFLRLLPGTADHGGVAVALLATAATPATCTRTSTARSSGTSPESRWPSRSRRRRSRSRSTSRRTSAPTPARRSAWRSSSATRARDCGPRCSARWPRWCRTRSTSTRWSRSARRCSR